MSYIYIDESEDLGTKKEQAITITASTNLTDEEIDKMMKEAEANREADEKKKTEVFGSESRCFNSLSVS